MAQRIGIGSGSAALGAAFGGGGNLREKAYDQRMQQLGQLFVAQQRGNKMQAETALAGQRIKAQQGLGDAMAAAYGVTPEVGNALASIAISASTSNPEQIAGIGMRRQAAAETDPVAANRILSALSGKPNDLTKISGDMAFDPTVSPENNTFTPTKPLKSGYVYHPDTGTASAVPITQAAGPPSHTNPNVTFDFDADTPPEVVQAAMAAARASGDLGADEVPSYAGQSRSAGHAPASTLAGAIQNSRAVTSKGSKIDQRAQDISDLRARGVDVSDADAQNYLATGKMGAGFQGNSTAEVFGDPSVDGEAYLQTIPESERAVVKGVLNGTKSLPTGSALKSPYWQSVMASAMHADPSWNEASYKQYANTRKEFTTGRQGRVINGINTAMQHAHELMEAINALDNPSFRPAAAAKNLNRYFGNQDVTNFESIVTALASEMAGVYKNGNSPTDQETKEWREQITPNMSKGQQMNVLRRWISLLSGKMNATRRQYRQGMSNMAEPLTVVSKDAREAMERIYDMADQLSDQKNPAAPALNDAPIYAPGGTVPRSGGDVSQQGGQQPMQQQPQVAPRATNPQTGETVVWDSSKHAWVLEQ